MLSVIEAEAPRSDEEAADADAFRAEHAPELWAVHPFEIAWIGVALLIAKLVAG
ncbi:MAG TPA: hypothetical protein VLJ20_03955 [Acetobacteraceae bacterium]|nr:hypothetical protein [Acetobacteraceae bacterium]